VVTQEADSLQIQPDDEKKDDEEIAALPPVLNVNETCWGEGRFRAAPIALLTISLGRTSGRQLVRICKHNITTKT
jgi:hypothetical protein